MTIAEMEFQVSPEIIAALHETFNRGIYRYTDLN